MGNWEAAQEFPRKHKVNSWKVGAEFLESRGGFPRKHMGETPAEQRGDFLKRKVGMPICGEGILGKHRRNPKK